MCLLSNTKLFLEAIHGIFLICESDKDLKSKKEVDIAKRLISEQLEIDSIPGNIKVKDKSKISSDSLQSAYDTDATYREKAGKKQSGYVVNITETCGKENELQLITDYTVEKNIKSDVEIATERIPEIYKHTDCEDLYADGGYYSKEVIDKGNENGIMIHYTDMTGKVPAKDKLSAAQFEYNEEDGTISSCPLGNKPTQTSKTKGQVVAHFDEDGCSHCLLFDNCPSKKQRNNYVVRLSFKNIEASKQRKEIRNNIKENTSKRAAIEGTNSALKRKQGLGKLKVRGKHKSTVVTGFMITAHNFIKFAKHMLNICKKNQREMSPKIVASIFQ